MNNQTDWLYSSANAISRSFVNIGTHTKNKNWPQRVTTHSTRNTMHSGCGDDDYDTTSKKNSSSKNMCFFSFTYTLALSLCLAHTAEIFMKKWRRRKMKEKKKTIQPRANKVNNTQSQSHTILNNNSSGLMKKKKKMRESIAHARAHLTKTKCPIKREHTEDDLSEWKKNELQEIH